MKNSKTNVCCGATLNKKAFTLVELLAVIVILAIIALIAVPKIVSIIRDTKEKAMQINAQNYMDAVELAVADGHMVKGEEVLISGTYDIIKNGKVIKLIKDENDNLILEEKDQIELPVKYTGEGLKSGTVKLIDGKVRKVTDVMTNEDYHVLIILGEVKIFKKVNPVTLTTGGSFNSKIKTLVSGTETKYDIADATVKSIEFLGYGIIPSGYTLEGFQKLERVDVSSNQDETIYAIYDGKDKVYIYAEDAIAFNKNSNSMFQNFKSVEKILFGEYVDTNNVIDMSKIFYRCSSLFELDVSNFDTSQVTGMHGMFYDCRNLTKIDVSNFNTSKVTNMQAMFEECHKLTTLDVSNFNTSNVTNMWWMFSGCSSLTSIDVSKFDTSKVTTMSQMFQGCSSLTNLDVSKFDTSKVTTMSQMFQGCSSLTELDVSNFNTSKVTNMTSMFMNCSSLKELNLSGFDTANVTSLYLTFAYCSNLTNLDVSKWDTRNVTNMREMLAYCSSLTNIDVSNWDTTNVTSMHRMFVNCSSLSLLDLSNWDTSKVTNMYYMFAATTNLKPIYVGEKWVINEGTEVTAMFWLSKTSSVEELCEPGSTEEWCLIN